MPQIKPRSLSPGEKSDLKRRQQWAKAHPTTKNNAFSIPKNLHWHGK